MLVIGAVHLDDIAQPIHLLVPQASNPVTWTQRVGGVAANAACAAARILEAPSSEYVAILAAVGDDATAYQLKQTLHNAGVGTQLHVFPGEQTGRYTAVMTEQGELHIGLADVSLAERLGESYKHQVPELHNFNAVLIDANLSKDYLARIANHTNQQGLSLAAMSVSPVKTLRILSIAKQIEVLFCNRREALSMVSHLSAQASLTELADGLCQAGFTQLVLTDGSLPLLVQDDTQRVQIDVPNVESTHNVNGAGDALAGASFAAWVNGVPLVEAVQDFGLVQAAMVVRGDIQAPQIDTAITH